MILPPFSDTGLATMLAAGSSGTPSKSGSYGQSMKRIKLSTQLPPNGSLKLVPGFAASWLWMSLPDDTVLWLRSHRYARISAVTMADLWLSTPMSTSATWEETPESSTPCIIASGAGG